MSMRLLRLIKWLDCHPIKPYGVKIDCPGCGGTHALIQNRFWTLEGANEAFKIQQVVTGGEVTGAIYRRDVRLEMPV